ncbi:MAG: pyridoxamine 5'-phosphate oxidase family protein [Thermoplasmata archaeon]
MTALPEEVRWEKREGPAVFATVNRNGEPNAIYVSCIKKRNEEQFVIADNYFDKTRTNIENGSHGSILFITDDHESFQIKGTISYHTEGEVYEEMRGWLEPRFPGHAAAVLTVKEVYQGADRLA